MSLAIVAAVTAVALRSWRERRARRLRPGATLERAVVVRRFDEIDRFLQNHRCAYCGGPTRMLGEFSRPSGERRYRVARIACRECAQEERVHFDVTAAFH
jgi:hypothetical protein